jgi:hypothetical protein
MIEDPAKSLLLTDTITSKKKFWWGARRRDEIAFKPDISALGGSREKWQGQNIVILGHEVGDRMWHTWMPVVPALDLWEYDLRSEKLWKRDFVMTKDSASSHVKASAPMPPKFALIAAFSRILITGKSCPRTSLKAIPEHGLVITTFV